MMIIIIMFYRNSCNANSIDIDQMPHSAASDLDLYGLPIKFVADAILKFIYYYLSEK